MSSESDPLHSPEAGSATHSPEAGSATPPIPPRVGRYLLLRQIGSGGFADVYLGQDPERGTRIALKILRENIDPRVRDQVRARFLAEEAIARAIGHPAVVRILETSPRGERPCFIAMEYVDGLPFCEHFRRYRTPETGESRAPSRAVYISEVSRLGYEVACAMDAAHHQDIVHRDLKPDNVLVSLEAGIPSIRILDFGIAKAPPELFPLERVAAVTRYYTELGTVMGSPPYMAPEQNGAAHTVTGKADVFALGVMLLMALLGLPEARFEQGEQRLVLPKAFDALVAGTPLPEALRTLLRSMLDQDPLLRPTMREVALRLQRVARRHETFGQAVEAWLRHGRLPPSKELLELARYGDSAPHLTQDERAFLQTAPRQQLGKLRVRSLILVAACLLSTTAAAAAVALNVRRAPTALLPALLPAEGAVLAAVPASAPGSPMPTKADGRPAQGASAACDDPSSARDDRDRDRDRDDRDDRDEALAQHAQKNAEQLTTIRSLGAAVSEQKRERQRLAHEVTQLSARLANGERQISDCRSDADHKAQGLSDCRRDLEVHLGQLAESAERLRLCTRSLREQAQSPSSDFDHQMD